jgi:hypothetical protein
LSSSDGRAALRWRTTMRSFARWRGITAVWCTLMFGRRLGTSGLRTMCYGHRQPTCVRHATCIGDPHAPQCATCT